MAAGTSTNTSTSTKSTLKPLGDRVVVKPTPKEEMTKSGIVLPDTAKEKAQEGSVIAVGNGRLNDDGKRVALDVKEGDRVIYAKYAGTEIELDDPFENMGAQLLKEAATKTNDVAGDGTTTATVLDQAIVTEGLRNVAAGANPMLLKRGIDQASQKVVVEIKAMATPVQGQ